jgi:hypothetical protein
MRILTLALLLASCASAHPTEATAVTRSPPGPPPPSRAWTGGTHKVGDYAVYARAIDHEDSELQVDLSITGPDLSRLVRDDVKATIAIGDKLTRCEGSELSFVEIHGAPAIAPSATALFRCSLSVAGAAALVIEIKGAREKVPINLQPA